MTTRATTFFWATLITGLALATIFTGMVIRYRSQLRAEIRQTLINRDAAVLRPVALRQLAQREAASVPELLPAVLESADQENMLAVVIFDAEGHMVNFLPDSLLFAELPLDDYLRLLKHESISRYFPDFPLNRYFSGPLGQSQPPTKPVLEVLIPLHGRDASRPLGFARYYIDAHALAEELAVIDGRINRQTTATLAIGVLLIAVVISAASLGLIRAQRAVSERNERLMRANVELALAAKASAVGQITSHLLHGLQGSLAGLHAVVADQAAPQDEPAAWKIAAGYAAHMQEIIQETISLLGDVATNTTYELTGNDLVAIVAQRNQKSATARKIRLNVTGGFEAGLDSHRGGLLCLIINNLVSNALAISEIGSEVSVIFHRANTEVFVQIIDHGPGIPDKIRAHLFEPGRSGRPGGTGLGLAISQLLARQIGANLILENTSAAGTIFRISLPLKTPENPPTPVAMTQSV